MSVDASEQITRLQRRTVTVLAAATVLGGLGIGATASVGSLLLVEVSGSDALAGIAITMSHVGAALAGIPLAALAIRFGRRPALVTGSTVAMLGAAVCVVAAMIGQWWVLALGLVLLGVANAVQLLSRFAATDLAAPGKRARDLSLVVWAITAGAVIGPNLIGPGSEVGKLIGVTPLAGAFVFPFVAQLLAAGLNWLGLRPDSLLTAQLIRNEAASSGLAQSSRPASPRPAAAAAAQWRVIVMIAMAQAMMIALMAMTPLHLMHHAGTPQIVGFTISLHIAGMYAISPVFGMLAGRFGSIQVVRLGWLLFFVSLLLAYISGSSHFLVQVALTLLGLAWSAVTVAGASLLTEISSPDERPRWQGRSDTIMSAAAAVSGALAGLFFAGGGFPLLSLVSAVLLLVGAAASLRFPGARTNHGDASI